MNPDTAPLKCLRFKTGCALSVHPPGPALLFDIACKTQTVQFEVPNAAQWAQHWAALVMFGICKHSFAWPAQLSLLRRVSASNVDGAHCGSGIVVLRPTRKLMGSSMGICRIWIARYLVCSVECLWFCSCFCGFWEKGIRHMALSSLRARAPLKSHCVLRRMRWPQRPPAP